MDVSDLPSAAQLSSNLFLSGSFKAAADVARVATLESRHRAEVVSGSTKFGQGDYVRIVGLKSRDDLNGMVGKVVRYFAAKDRWAVQVDRTGCAEPVLIRLENLQRTQVCSVVDHACSDPQFATERGFKWAGRSIRLFGVRGYSSSQGSDEIFYGLASFKPGVVLMESFNVGEEEVVAPGDALPYERIFPRDGLEKAMAAVTDSQTRANWSAELVAVLSALRVGAELRCCDRLHSLSFDRLIQRYSLAELKTVLIQATELVAQCLETISERRNKQGGDVVKLSDVPQNVLCPLFPELGSERQDLMCHFARLAAEQGHDVAVIVGVEHLSGISEQFDHGDACTPAEAKTLLSDVQSDAKMGDAAWDEEIEKRTVAAAFLRATRTFPPETVLPPAEQLLPEVTAVVKQHYRRYLEAFNARILTALGGPNSMAAMAMSAQNVQRIPGLAQLQELCKA